MYSSITMVTMVAIVTVEYPVPKCTYNMPQYVHIMNEVILYGHVAYALCIPVLATYTHSLVILYASIRMNCFWGFSGMLYVFLYKHTFTAVVVEILHASLHNYVYHEWIGFLIFTDMRVALFYPVQILSSCWPHMETLCVHVESAGHAGQPGCLRVTCFWENENLSSLLNPPVFNWS